MQMTTLRLKDTTSMGGCGRVAILRALPLAVLGFLGMAGMAMAEDPNLARYGAASASSYWNSTFAPGKGIDNSTSTLWSTGAGDTAAWWQLDLGSAFKIIRVQVQSRQDVKDDPEARMNFEVRGSNNEDGTGYTVLASKDGTPFAYMGTWTAEVAETASFRFLRVVKTDTNEFSFAEFRTYSGAPVTNGGFETGNTNGWMVTSSDANPAYCGVFSGQGTADGTYALGLGTDNHAGNAIISQTVATQTRRGYTLRIYFGAFANKNQDQVLYVEALDGSTVLASQTNTRKSTAVYPAPATYTLYDLAFTATSETTTIRFTDKTTLANSNACDGMLDFIELLLVNLATAAPTFSPVAGSYDEPQTVTLNCATAGATIHYTIDGTEPSATHGLVYGAPFEVRSSKTVKAIGILNGRTDSGVATADYTLPLTGTTIVIR